MKITTIDENGNETTRLETRDEVKARHARMMEEHKRGMEMLETLRGGKPLYVFQGSTGWAAMAEETKKNRSTVSQQDQGLTTEINTSSTLVSIRDTVENCADILRRHPFGFRDGDEEGSEVLTPDNGGRAVLIPEKVDPYLNKSPKMKNGKLIWVDDTKQTA